jgi:threonine aldolase
MKRRGFMAAPLAASLSAAASDAPAERQVAAVGDGVPLSPIAYAAILSKVSGRIEADNYALGGVVEQLEKHMAGELGKEFAVWMPTGTLANHLALRTLAGDRRRALVQAECHLYNDCGDCCQTLSGLNLIPLAPGRATFTLEEAQEAFQRAGSGRVKTPIGAIQIESPVRRKTGETFDIEQMRKISRWARGESIGMHLDGARLYMGAAYTGVSIRDYAALFDTVYVSMYKYFGAASGAILAGPKPLLADLFHVRRMFGGGQHEAWPFAAVAFENCQGFSERFAQAVRCSEAVIAALKSKTAFEVERVNHGSNLFFLKAKGQDPIAFRRRANAAGLTLGAPQGERFVIAVNETWNRASAAEITSRFEKSLA